MTKRFKGTWKGWWSESEIITAIKWYRIAMLQHFLLYFYLHLSICLPLSRWHSLQLPSLPHVKGNEAAVPLVASRLKDLQDVQITKKQHGRMAIQCTHLEQSTLGKRKPLGSRCKSISWGHSCSFWSRPFHSDMNDKWRDALCVPTSGLKRCCELVGLQFTPNMAVTFFLWWV